MTTGDLFGDTPVDWGAPRPSLARARRLVERVERVWEEEGQTWELNVADCALEAQRLRAHALQRGLLWLLHPKAYERHDSESMDIRVERIARNWLARLERSHA